jgi:hypothetical protein
MSVVRRGTIAADNFVTLSNAFVRDVRLSLKARALGAWLMSHRDGWNLSVDTIAKTIGEKDGVTAVKTGLIELEKAGYLKREQSRDGSHFGAVDYVISDVPAGEIVSGFPADGEPREREIGPHKKTIPQEDHSEEPSAAADAPSKPVAYSEAFEAAWKEYGRKGAKRAAWAEWQRAIKRAPVEVIAAGIAPYLANKPDPKFRKDFERWLKGDVWESADAQTAGQPAPDAMTFEEADAWLHARWTEGAAETVAARCRRPFRAQPAPAALIGQDRQDYDLRVRREWIKQNRHGLRSVLMGRAFQNGTEVQS